MNKRFDEERNSIDKGTTSEQRKRRVRNDDSDNLLSFEKLDIIERSGGAQTSRHV